MLRIRLTRVGKKNSPAYRVVVAESSKAVKRKFIEIIGNYNPAANPKTLVIDKEKSLEWIKKGAQPSDTVKNLMCDLGILSKESKVNKIYAKKKETEAEITPEATEEVAEEAVDEETPTEPTESVEDEK